MKQYPEEFYWRKEDSNFALFDGIGSELLGIDDPEFATFINDLFRKTESDFPALNFLDIAEVQLCEHRLVGDLSPMRVRVRLHACVGAELTAYTIEVQRVYRPKG